MSLSCILIHLIIRYSSLIEKLQSTIKYFNIIFYYIEKGKRKIDSISMKIITKYFKNIES